MSNGSIKNKWEKKRLFLLELYKPKTAKSDEQKVAGETLLNIFPNPCTNETYFYSDDPQVAWLVIMNLEGLMIRKLPINPGKTLHFHINCEPGMYNVLLLDAELNQLGSGKVMNVTA